MRWDTPVPATQVCDVKTLLVHGPKDCFSTEPSCLTFPGSRPTTTRGLGPVWWSLRVSTKPATLSIAGNRGVGSKRADVGSSVSVGVMTHVACSTGTRKRQPLLIGPRARETGALIRGILEKTGLKGQPEGRDP